MTTHPTTIPHPTGRRTARNCIYVLWGDGFDELTAVTAVTMLRQAGYQVKLVGLRRQPIAGAYGVMLVPEIGLDEALTKAAPFCGLIVPCTDAGWQRLQLEPRVGQLLALIQANGAHLFIGCQDAPAWSQVESALDTFIQMTTSA